MLRRSSYGKQDIYIAPYNGCVFSPDGIDPVQDEITCTRLVCYGVKKREANCSDVEKGVLPDEIGLVRSESIALAVSVILISKALSYGTC